MQLFVAVAEAQSFTRAAQSAGISAPAVTRALASLEKRLGVALLQRTTRRVRLTEAGGRYLEDCRRILQELREAEQFLAGSQASPQGLLQITAPVMFGQLLVMPVIREFLERHPGVTVRAIFLDRVVNLLEEGHDVALRIGDLADSAMIAWRVGEVRRLLCASPDYFARQGRPDSVAELANHRLIAAGELGPVGEWRFAHHSLKIRPRLLVNTTQASVDAALAGWGLARHLSYQVAAHLQSGRLETCLSHEEPTPWPVNILHHEGQRVSLKVRTFVDLLAERLRGHPYLQASNTVAIPCPPPIH